MNRRDLLGLGLAGLAAIPAARAEGYDVQPWPAGDPTPPLEAAGLDGRRWRLAELRGRPVLVNFWASWCEPCRAEMPTLQQLAELHGTERLAVLAVNFKESAGTASRFVQRTGLSLPVLLDPDGAVARAFGVRVFPTTLLVDAEGRVRQRVRGEMDWTGQAAERLVAPLLTR